MKQSEELEFLDLVVRYQDHALDEAGTSRLNHWIQGSTRARELFQDTALHALKVYELHNGGYAEYSCPSQAKRPKSDNRILGFPVRVWAAAAAVVFMAGLALFWNPGQSPSVGPSAASGIRVAEVSGEVIFTLPDGSLQTYSKDVELAAGSTIATGPAGSRAVLFYADGTRMLIGPSTQLTLGGQNGKLIQLDHGVLTSEIALQRDGRFLRFQTGGAEVEVLGTGISLVRLTGEPLVLVHEGRVRVTRLKDGMAEEVSAGEQVLVASTGSLEVTASPEVPAIYSEDFEADAAGWVSGKKVDGSHFRLEPVGYTLPGEGEKANLRRPIALIMENGTLMQHEYVRQEPGGFYVREKLSGREIFLPRNRVDQFSIYGEWTDGNGIFKERKYAARKPESEAFIDFDLNGVDDRRQIGPGKAAYSEDSIGIVHDENGVSYTYENGVWKKWDESYRAELSDARIHGREGWVELAGNSKMVLRYQTLQDAMVQLVLELIHPQKLEQTTLKRELQLTATEEWTTLKVPLDQAGHYLFSLRLESASPGLVIDDVQVGAQPK